MFGSTFEYYIPTARCRPATQTRLSFEMPGDWRFTLRQSKTERVVRVNFEARKTADTLLEKGLQVFEVLEPFRADENDWLANFRIH